MDQATEQASGQSFQDLEIGAIKDDLREAIEQAQVDDELEVNDLDFSDTEDLELVKTTMKAAEGARTESTIRGYKG
jgi:hypothetical protein